jgi:four helix bundle protein
MKSVKELDVFKLAHEMALEIYRVTKDFPDEERFGLISQMRRAASSVPMNLVEGANRLNSKEYRQFVGIAKGSAGEISYQLLLAKDLKYIDQNTYETGRSNYDRICQMLTKLAKSLK